MTYPYGVHAAVVEVDAGPDGSGCSGTWWPTSGCAINPMLVEGQLTARGPGDRRALFEELSYDDAGQPQAITFIEYRMPTAAEIPPVDVLLAQDAPSPGNPLA